MLAPPHDDSRFAAGRRERRDVYPHARVGRFLVALVSRPLGGGRKGLGGTFRWGAAFLPNRLRVAVFALPCTGPHPTVFVFFLLVSGRSISLLEAALLLERKALIVNRK